METCNDTIFEESKDDLEHSWFKESQNKWMSEVDEKIEEELIRDEYSSKKEEFVFEGVRPDEIKYGSESEYKKRNEVFEGEDGNADTAPHLL